jgi:hypothetical protein
VGLDSFEIARVPVSAFRLKGWCLGQLVAMRFIPHHALNETWTASSTLRRVRSPGSG